MPEILNTARDKEFSSFVHRDVFEVYMAFSRSFSMCNFQFKWRHCNSSYFTFAISFFMHPTIATPFNHIMTNCFDFNNLANVINVCVFFLSPNKCFFFCLFLMFYYICSLTRSLSPPPRVFLSFLFLQILDTILF